jgi:CBS domain-containing protein
MEGFMAEGKTIQQAIQRKFPEININDNLESALKIMTEANVSVLAGKIGEELVGLITVSDVMFSLSNGDDIKETKVSSFMTKCEFNNSKETRNPCIQLDEDEDALAAIKVMYEAGVHHLLVSGTGGKVTGIVSALELVKLFGPSITDDE